MKSSEQKGNIITLPLAGEISNIWNLTNGWIVVVSSFERNWYITVYDPMENKVVDVIKEINVENDALKIYDDSIVNLVPLTEGRFIYQTRCNQIQIYDPGSKNSNFFEAKNENILALCLMPNNEVLCLVSRKESRMKQICVINLETRKISIFQEESWTDYRAARCWKEMLILVRDTGTVELIDLTKKQKPTILSNETGHFPGIKAISQLDNLLMIPNLIGHWSICFKIYDLAQKKIVKEFTFPENMPTNGIILPSNHFAFGRDEFIEIYDMNNPKPIMTIENQSYNDPLLLSPDLNLLSASNKDVTDIIVSIDLGLREELKKEFEAYKNVIAGSLPQLSQVSGVISEYLIMERKKLFRTENEILEDTKKITSEQNEEPKSESPGKKARGD